MSYDDRWFTLQDLGKLSVEEECLRNEMSLKGNTPEEIRDAIEQRRVSELDVAAANPFGDDEIEPAPVSPTRPGTLIEQYQDDIRILEEGATKLFDELKLLRQHTIALYETLVQQEFTASEIPTADILQLLTTQGKQVIDQFRANQETLSKGNMSLGRDAYLLQKRTDKVVGLLAQALMACTAKDEASGEGRLEPPTFSVSSQSP